MNRNPLIAVDAIIEEDDKILLVHRKNDPQGWALPGGFVEKGETLKEACRREVYEETGLKVEIKESEISSGEFGIYDDPDRDSRKHVISVVFLCNILSGEVNAGDDAGKAEFKSRDFLKRTELAFDHNQILDDYFGY